MTHRIAWLALLTLAGTTPAQAQRPAPNRPELLGNLVECRRIPDIEARVACYDRQVDRFDEAERRGDVVVVDRKQVQETRRSLFGLRLPQLAIFGRDDQPQAEPQVTEVETTLQAATEGRDGRWQFVLADGARWRQTETRPLSYIPKPGQKIRIRQAAFGSYLANIEDHIAIRVARVN